MAVMVTLRNGVGLIKGLSKEVNDTLSDICAFKVQGAEKSELYRKRRWDGMKRLYNKQKCEFPMGLWHRIKFFLDDHKISYQIIDERTDHTPVMETELSDFVELRDYQEDAVKAAIEARRSILQVATGGGKTVIASLIINRLQCTTLFLVHTKDLLYQAKESFETMLQNQGTVGQIGDGVIDIQDITVATMQTVSKFLGIKVTKNSYDDADTKEKAVKATDEQAKQIQDLVNQVNLVIWDETHRVACDMAFEISNKLINAPYRVGLSASPWRDDGADMMIEAAMGHVSFKVSASELIEMGYLVQPVVRRVKMPALIPHDRDNRSYDTIYKEEIVENTARNELILKYAMDFMDIGLPTLILVQQIKHGNALKKLITERYDPIDFLSGRNDSFTRNRTIQEMRDGDRFSLIASTIADEGLDIKRLAGLILAGGGKSSTRALQRIGRVLRTHPDKTHALIIDFDDQAKYLRDHSEKRKEIFQSEPLFHILEL